MTWSRSILAVVLGITLTADASAQFFPVFNLPVILQPGVDFQYKSRRLQINGFFPTGNPYTAIVPVTPMGFRTYQQVGPAFVPLVYSYPPLAPGYPYPGYGSIDQRVTVQIITPPGIPTRAGFRPVPDLSGIDLDLEPASKIWGEKPALAKGPKKGEAVEPPKVEIAKAEPEEVKPRVAAAAKQAKAAPPPDGQRFHDDGIAAFRKGEFGVALLRFRQSNDADQPAPRAVFLRAQACIAVGKYHEAVELIQQGLSRRPDWPASGFHPRLELYDTQEAEWKAHRAALEQARVRNPQDADCLFLLGYMAWFEGQREVAVDHFTRCRALAVEPRWADLFLKAANAK